MEGVNVHLSNDDLDAIIRAHNAVPRPVQRCPNSGRFRNPDHRCCGWLPVKGAYGMRHVLPFHLRAVPPTREWEDG